MKQYEKMKMSTEDALKWTGECVVRNCDDCPANGFPSDPDGLCCPESYLLSEVPEPPKVPRWMTAKTQEDFSLLYQKFRKHCDAMGHCFNNNDGEDCPYALDRVGHEGGCVFAYLQELVDAPESEDIVENG